MADDGPIASRTRSRMAARSATAETAAITNARNQLLETQRLLAEGDRRAASAFQRRGQHDVIADMTDSARRAIGVSRMTRISDRLADEIQRIRNVANNTIASLMRGNSHRSQGTINNRRIQIIEARLTMDQDVRSLYNISQEIYRYLNVEQMLYIARNSITENYYFRKLELAYGTPTIDKLNQLCQDIIDNMPIAIYIPGMPYRYDIDYYCQIINFLEGINTQILLVSNKQDIKNTLINELMNSINNEKITVNNLIAHLRDINNPYPNITIEIEQTIEKLQKRRDDLNKITRTTITHHFEDEQFEQIRIYTLVILHAAKNLCKIFLLLIIKLYNIQDRPLQLKATNYETIITEMYNAIANFTQIMSTSSSDYDELRLLYTVQISLYNDIKSSLSVRRRRRTTLINEYNNQRSTQFRIVYNIISESTLMAGMHPLTYELDMPIIDIETIFIGRRRRVVTNAEISLVSDEYRRATQELRRQAAVQREQERIAVRAAERSAREARAAAIAAARLARAEARAARPSSARPRAVRGPTSASLTNIDDMFEIDANADMQFTTTYITDAHNRYKETNDSFLQKLKEKYIHHSKDFKSSAQRQLIFNEIKLRFSTKFNSDEPTPRITNSVENFVGNSIASLFARYLSNGSDIKFNDLGKYYVINYTLQKESDNPDITLANKYIKIRQAGIDAGGLRRDFITALTEELFQKKIFITREGTKKYFLNPFYEPDEEFKFIVKIVAKMDILDDEPFIRNFYFFIGQLLSFILVNDCGIQHHLSSYIMANFNNRFTTDIKEYDYVYYMLMDFPEFSKSLLNLMADPANIEEWACIGFNDYYKLTSEDIDVNANNIEEYIRLVSKFMMTTTILRKIIDIPSEIDENEFNRKAKLMHDCLVTGINLDIKIFLKPFTLKSLDSYLVTPSMSDDIVNKLVRNFTNSMNKKIRFETAAKKAKSEKLTELFISRILTNPNPNNKETFFKFIDKLLKFWSGSAFYKDNEEYKIQINPGLSATHLPQSHTCFFLIDLPDYTTVGNDTQIGNTLYDKINTAISNVEGGMGFAGGKKPTYRRLK